MPNLKSILRSFWTAAATACLAIPSGAEALAGPMEWGVTDSGLKTLLVDDQQPGTAFWCGNDTLVYVRGRVGDSMYQSGDLMQANVATGEVKTLRAEIFKFYGEVFTDWPADWEGDSAGVFFTWPLGCSPDGQWLFYRHEEYDGPISKDARRPELRALNLATGQEHVLASRVVASVWPAPDGRRLVIGKDPHRRGSGNTGSERAAPPHWELVDLPDNHFVVGWLGDSKSVVVGKRGKSGKMLWGLYDVTVAGAAFRPFMLPDSLQARLAEGSTPHPLPRFAIQAVRPGRVMGILEERTPDKMSTLTTFYRCDIEQLALRCQNSAPVQVTRHRFVWSHDGTAVFYERNSESNNKFRHSQQTVRRDIASGEEEVVLVDGDGLRGHMSPKGDRLLLGHWSLKVLFLRPPSG